MLNTVLFAADLLVAVAVVAVQLVKFAVVTVVRDGVALASDFVVAVALVEVVVVAVVLDAISVLSVWSWSQHVVVFGVFLWKSDPYTDPLGDEHGDLRVRVLGHGRDHEPQSVSCSCLDLRV